MKQLDIDSSGDREFFEMSLDHLCVAGFDGYWKRLNPSWMRTLGFTAEELMAVPLIEFVHPDDREMTLNARGRLKVGEPLRWLVNRYRCKDGSYRWFEWRSVANPERQVVYAIARDVTDEREAQRVLQEARETQERMQRQLILADRMASVGMLAAGVAHEINNPLAYVMANLDMILEELSGLDPAVSARLAECLGMARDAQQGAERIRKIVRGLKTFSRAEDERPAIIDVTQVLELAIQMTFNEIRHRAQFVRDYAPMPLVEADDARLGQVFINLLVNAAQAIGDGSPEANEIRLVTGTDASGNAFIEVRDTGPGIPADAMARIFDPFFTTKPIGIGTGLGLSICHNILASMGGQIAASNGESRGAVFRVTLPAASAPVVEAATVATSEPTVSPRASILVVDDEAAIGQVLRFRLREHDVTAVTSARAALDQLAAGTRFDVILSDLMMPEMSGMQLFEELQRAHPGVVERVVFMTGGAFTASARAFLDRVPNQCLEKPFTATALRAAIQRFVK
ncbi:MAG: response regulator [Kofleriaceae bacterium]|nr:response regulator [Kofleriaceae bacterium]